MAYRRDSQLDFGDIMYRALGNGRASRDEGVRMTRTYVLENLTSSIACSKECRGGVAVDVVEGVCEFDGRIQSSAGA